MPGRAAPGPGPEILRLSVTDPCHRHAGRTPWHSLTTAAAARAKRQLSRRGGTPWPGPETRVTSHCQCRRTRNLPVPPAAGRSEMFGHWPGGTATEPVTVSLSLLP